VEKEIKHASPKLKFKSKKREKKFGKKLRRCGGKKRCIVRVCKVRAVKVAKRKGKGRKYVRKLVKKYTRLNCKRVTVVKRRHVARRRVVAKRRVVVKRRVFRKNLRVLCKRVAVRKCGKGNKSCIRKVKVQIKKREKKFGKKLRRCGGKTRCVARICKVRAVKVAKRKGKGRKYVRKLVKKYTRLNCTRRVRKSIRKIIKKVRVVKRRHIAKRRVVVKKRVFRKNLRVLCKRVAVRKCGKGNKSCIRKVKVQIKKREKKFGKKIERMRRKNQMCC